MISYSSVVKHCNVRVHAIVFDLTSVLAVNTLEFLCLSSLYILMFWFGFILELGNVILPHMKSVSWLPFFSLVFISHVYICFLVFRLTF